MRRGRISDFAAGAIAIAVIAVAVFFGFTKTVPFVHHYQIKAVFRTSDNLRKDAPVRIAGVAVGKVSEVEHTAKGSTTATVTMEIKGNGRPVHRDATAKIRPRIFLGGNYFVDLQPGTPGSPEMPDGGVIPVNQTSTPVDFSRLFQVFTSDTRKELQQALGNLADAYVHGAAQNYNASLPYQAPAYRFSAIVADALLGQEPHDLSNYVRDQGAVSAAIDRNPQQLRDLITSFNATLAALARRELDLRATVAELPRTLRAAGPAFDALNAAFPPTRRLAVEALPAVRSSNPTIDRLLPLVRQLRGLVSPPELRGLSSDLRATTPSLAKLATGSVPLLDQARAASSCQNQVILPWSQDKIDDQAFPATGPVFQEAVKWLPGLAGESRSFDANGQWFKVLGTGGTQTFDLGANQFGTALFPLQGINPPPPAGRPPLRPDVPCETQQAPDLRSTPRGPPAQAQTSDSAAVRERASKARAVAIDELRAQGAKVLDRLATSADISRLAAQAGNSAQLRKVTGGGG